MLVDCWWYIVYPVISFDRVDRGDDDDDVFALLIFFGFGQNYHPYHVHGNKILLNVSDLSEHVLVQQVGLSPRLTLLAIK